MNFISLLSILDLKVLPLWGRWQSEALTEGD